MSFERHSSLTDFTQRSANEFKSGLRAGSLTGPSAPFLRTIRSVRLATRVLSSFVFLDTTGLAIGLHLGLVLGPLAALVYGVARAAGLADLGRRVDLVERSTRRGEGDPELAEAVRRDTEGEWD